MNSPWTQATAYPFFRRRTRLVREFSATGIVLSPMAATLVEYQAFTPGSSWNFQFWYRNPQAGGAKFNLSDGLHVNFAP